MELKRGTESGTEELKRGTETGTEKLKRGTETRFKLLRIMTGAGNIPEKAGNIRKYPVKCVRIMCARLVPYAAPLIST